MTVYSLENYKRIVEELYEKWGDIFSIKDLLNGNYDPHDIFEDSLTIQKIALKKLLDRVHSIRLKNIMSHLDIYWNLGASINVLDVVEDILDDMRRYWDQLRGYFNLLKHEEASE